MAKQTFTTGQVLTAAQMQSLQNTALGGGDATPKVASYVLVAADAGTTVAMNAAGATTITVNQNLFAAGDTVFIQNRGAGACTVTAGTATVATAGSLILPQNDAGILYFTSASAAIFYDYIQAGAVSPLTTKGDLYTFSTSDARLGVGANGTTLVADSAEATGLKWATPAGGSNFTLLNTGGTALTGSQTITVSSISGIDEILVFIYRASSAAATAVMTLRLNTDTGNNYQYGFQRIWSDSAYSAGILEGISNDSATSIPVGRTGGDAAGSISGVFRISGCNTTNPKVFTMGTGSDLAGSNNGLAYNGGGVYVGTSTISSVSLITSGGNFDAGTIYIYGSAA